ncbi:dTDP-4-dehydrorhamnose reductase [Litorivivens lipolytica]|uniref:dTDP-4-dehydrorhamnose reductase n=1 Tax=Litorivivens lipolytica TaxID=1524264 RepID=A0A7W4W5Y7_9GAMM|nr:sugar nucleotide-binding protein [Litorivivens lipolytica]MBB3047474.1 dTDP-4-dehydrorhamnose reductase [Litorivivens lipolytica]
MNVLVIAEPSALQQAVCHWFEARERAFRLVAPADILGLGRADVYNTVVLDLATLEGLQRGNELSLSGESRHHLIELLEASASPFIFLSDGRVFDGDYAPINHRETDNVQPGSVAGARLSAVEHLLERHIERRVILRTGPVFSNQPDNFFVRFFQRLLDGGDIALNSQLKTCPTHVADLARVISGVIDQVACGANNWGAYHYNSSSPTSAYEFAEVMFAFASQQLDLDQKATSLVVQESALRIEPAVPVLRCEKILHDFGIKQLPWRSYLPQPIKLLCEKQNP